MKLMEIKVLGLQGIDNPAVIGGETGIGKPRSETSREELLDAIQSEDDEARMNMLQLMAEASDQELMARQVLTRWRNLFRRLWKQNQSGGPFTPRQRADLKQALAMHVDVIAELAALKGIDLLSKATAPHHRTHEEDNIGLPSQEWLSKQIRSVQSVANFIKDLPKNVTNKQATRAAMESLPALSGELTEKSAENQIRMIRARIEFEGKEQYRDLMRGHGVPHTGKWDWQHG